MGNPTSLWTTPPGHAVLLYDGHCRVCGGAAREFRKWVGGTGLQLRSFREDGALAAFPGLTLARCEEAMQLVLADGRVVQGAEAIVRALGGHPLGRLLSLYYVPGLRQLADVLYGVVARHRFRVAGRACPDGACSVHFK